MNYLILSLIIGIVGVLGIYFTAGKRIKVLCIPLYHRLHDMLLDFIEKSQRAAEHKRELISSRNKQINSVLVKRDKVQITFRQLTDSVLWKVGGYREITKDLRGYKLALILISIFVVFTLGVYYFAGFFEVVIDNKPLDAYGRITVGGSELNITQRVGGELKEIIVPLGDGRYEKKLALVDFQTVNTTVLFNYQIIKSKRGEVMTNKGGIIRNRIMFDISRTQKKQYEGQLANTALMMGLIFYSAVNRMYGHKLGQSMMRRRVGEK